jgi:hypothetical protein
MGERMEDLTAKEPTYQKTEYEVAREQLAEARITNNLVVLEGGTPEPELELDIEFWTAEARRLAQSANDVIVH